MTDQELAEIEARAKEAAKDFWLPNITIPEQSWVDVNVKTDLAKNDVPRLVAEVRRLRAELDAMEAQQP